MTKIVEAAGLIVYRLNNDNVEYLMLKSTRKSAHWTPPKGHVEKNESHMEAAKRETEEEAGLKENQYEIDDHMIKINYTVNSKNKQVTYWPAKLVEARVTINLSHEHCDYDWMTLDEFRKVTQYANTVDYGFKSYASFTSIGLFDKQFNAITGLNGSGKSNILDAICFVLGITNLSHVRASSLQELVFKNGQAGVTKASVSLVFNNTEKKDSPLGYIEMDEITVTRQVVVGGKNKYLINGNNAQAQRVRDLFLTVHLNVNNPHFLIMQGRITKVLNMKPAEILSIVEEAAGTSLYESKKAAVQKLIEKKDKKLSEIELNMREIEGRLETLRKDRASYLEYQKLTREFEVLNRLKTVFMYDESKNIISSHSDRIAVLDQEIVDLNNQHTQLNVELVQIKQDLEILNEKFMKCQTEEFNAVSAKNKNLEFEYNKGLASKNDLTNELESEQERCNNMIKLNKNVSESIEKSNLHLETIEKDLVTGNDLLKSKIKEQEEAANTYKSIAAGISVKGSDGLTVERKIMEYERDLNILETGITCTKNDLDHLTQNYDSKKMNFEKIQSEHTHKLTEIKNGENQLVQFENEIKNLHFDEKVLSMMSHEKDIAKNNIVSIDDSINEFDSIIYRYQIKFDDIDGFDQSKHVYGCVASLFTVIDPKFHEAIEILGGSRLQNIVVDNKETAKLLLEKGNLRHRKTFIPLDKILSRDMEQSRIDQAKYIGGDKVHTALSLLRFDEKVLPAMKFIFGQSFVCDDMNIAKKIAFDKNVYRRTITLTGDFFDPAGTLTGGSRTKSNSILEKMGTVTKLYNDKHNLIQKVKKYEADIQILYKKESAYVSLKHRYDMLKCQIDHLKNKLEQSSIGVEFSRFNAVIKLMDDYKNKIERNQVEIIEKKKSLDKLKHNLENSEQNNQNKLNSAQQKVEELKTSISDIKLSNLNITKEISVLKNSLASQSEELLSNKNQIDEFNEIKILNEKKLCKLNLEIAVIFENFKEAQSILKEINEKHKKLESEIRTWTKKQSEFVESINDCEIKLKEINYERKQKSQKLVQSQDKMRTLFDKNPWIENEKHLFGQKNTQYDYSKYTDTELDKRIHIVFDQKEKLSKKVNMRAMNLLGQAEDQYKKLMKRRSIVLIDKKTIGQVITELDSKKNEALKKAHIKVNKDFGRIFSTLLPDTNARLDAPENQSILDGLEIKVYIGSVWKSSLNELSGGQRSLVALSLILSLLLFNPAPIYILDEVDAALDSSHTQNVGTMIRKHFKNSQFIVVSLKDGMFNNADVLFKTKFINGVSTVQRQLQHVKR
ncbi:Structural maintenance of chromosomes protein 2 [Intoshia linei]|uniref:Structural maintenance of chromosomes protein n=1 Tax=Intoshia linei TaxID=1819745 RepID=A0A177B1U1_9BILA|nr:Structural maintenance of chromosomes protein 2 [Intoshia linei]